MATDTLHPESVAATYGGNVIPLRPRRVLCIEIKCPIPDPLNMPPAQYSKAWRTLCCYADEARAYRDYIEARWLLLRRTDEGAADNLSDDRQTAFDRMCAFIDRISDLPIPEANTVSQARQYIDRKKLIIGRIWLRAEGRRYDKFRASIAADEAALKGECKSC